MGESTWRERAAEQAGLLARWQLDELRVTRGFVRNQVRAKRWTEHTHTVIGTTTGSLTRDQQLWLGVLHGGPGAMLGGLTAAEYLGLTGWSRDDATVIVDDELSFDEVPGVQFFRTRRDRGALLSARALPPASSSPPYSSSLPTRLTLRTAHGAVAACMQQRLSTPERFRGWLERLRPLRGAGGLRTLLADLEGRCAVAGGDRRLPRVFGGWRCTAHQATRST